MLGELSRSWAILRSRRWPGIGEGLAALPAVLAGAGSLALYAAAVDSWVHPIPTVVARRMVPPGTHLAWADLQVRTVALRDAVPGAVRSPSGAVGRITRSLLTPGQPITTWDLSSSRRQSVPAVPPGRLLFAVPAGPGVLAPPLRPGQEVDALGSTEPGGPTQILGRNLPVVQVRSASSLLSGAGGGEVTLAVTLPVAVHLADALRQGSLFLAAQEGTP